MKNIIRSVILSGIVSCMAGCSGVETKKVDSTITPQIDIRTHTRFENQTKFIIFVALGEAKKKIEPYTHSYLPESSEIEYSTLVIARKADDGVEYLFRTKHKFRSNWIDYCRIFELDTGEIKVQIQRDPIKVSRTESIPHRQTPPGNVPRRRVIIPKEQGLTNQDSQ